VVKKHEGGNIRTLNHTDEEIEEAFRQMEMYMETDNGKET